MKDTDLKHLTVKTAFLLALASGKRCRKVMPGLQTKYLIWAMGKGCPVPLLRFHSQKPTSKRRLSKCVSGDYPCFDYHRGSTIQRRHDPASSTGPEVIYRSNQRPERVSIPTFYFLQERTYLRHQACYTLFWLKLSYFITNKQKENKGVGSLQQSKSQGLGNRHPTSLGCLVRSFIFFDLIAFNMYIMY